MKNLIFIFVFTLACMANGFLAMAQQAPQPTWQNFNTWKGHLYPGMPVPRDYTVSVKYDKYGNIYTAGMIGRGVTIDEVNSNSQITYPLGSTPNFQGYIIKRDPCGNLIWDKYFSGTTLGRILSIEFGEDENIYVFGYVSNAFFTDSATFFDTKMTLNFNDNFCNNMDTRRDVFCKINTDGHLLSVKCVPTGNSNLVTYYQGGSKGLLTHIGNNIFCMDWIFNSQYPNAVSLPQFPPNTYYSESIVAFNENLEFQWIKTHRLDYDSMSWIRNMNTRFLKSINKTKTGNLLVHLDLTKNQYTDTVWVFGQPFVPYSSFNPLSMANPLIVELDKNTGNIVRQTFFNKNFCIMHDFAFDDDNNMYSSFRGITDTTYFGYPLNVVYPHNIPGIIDAGAILKLDPNFNTIWGVTNDSIIRGNTPARTLSYITNGSTGTFNIATNKKNLFVYDRLGYHAYWGNARKYRPEVIAANNGNGGTFSLMRINKNNGNVELIDAPISLVEPNINYSSFIQSLTTNERGEVLLSGNYSQSMIINGQQTPMALKQTELILIRYGLPCGTNLSYNEPYAPKHLNATAISSSTIKLNWNDQSSIEWGFRIYRSTQGANGPFTLIDSVGENTQTFSNFFLQNSTWYWYKICAFNNEGCSVESNVDSAFTGPVAITEFNEKQAITTFPNPFNHSVNIQLNSFENEDWINIALVDVLGNILFNQNVRFKDVHTIDTSSLSNGIYIVKATGSSGKHSEYQMVKLSEE